MSTLTDLLSHALTSDNIASLAGQLGIENAQAKKALGLALPALIKGLEKNSATPEGASSLDNALAKDHESSLLHNISSLLGDTSTAEGAKITGHILGDHTEAVTQMIAEKSGLDVEKVSLLIKKLSPVVM